MPLDRESVISMIRACLLSIKGAITINELNRDFRTLVGEFIPYRKMGYNSYEDFLKTIPSVKVISTSQGVLVEAVPTKSTEHIAALVSRQRTAPKKGKTKVLLRSAAMRRPYSSGATSARPSVNRRYGVNDRSGVTSFGNAISAVKSQQPPSQSRTPWHERNRPAPSVTTPAPRLQSPKPEPKPVRESPAPSPAPTPKPTQKATPKPPKSPSKTTPVQKPPQELSPKRSPKLTPTPPATPPPTVTPTASPAPTPKVSPASISTSRLEKQPSLVLKWQPEGVSPQSSSPADLGDVELRCSALHSRLQSLSMKSSVLPDIDPAYINYLKSGAKFNYQAELMKLVEMLHLNKPEYKLRPRTPKGQAAIYSASLKVGEKKYNTYPNEYSNSVLAYESAAEKALYDLIDDVEKRQQHLPITINTEMVQTRIYEMVRNHPQGVFHKKIDDDYKQVYGEELPSKWLTMLQGFPLVNVEIYGNMVILIPSRPASNVKIEPFTANLVTLQSELVFPEEDMWDLYVMNVVSAAEIWVRLIEYNEHLHELLNQMLTEYEHCAQKVTDPQPSCYYALWLEDSHWHRVRLLSVKQDKGVMFFIDHGVQEVHSLDKLFYLDMQFSQLPAQAFSVSLHTLEEFSKAMEVTDIIMERIIDKCFIADVKNRERLSVILFDTSGEEDKNINRELQEEICRKIFTVELKEGQGLETTVTVVNERGEVFIRASQENLDYLENMMANLMNCAISESSLERAKNHDCDPSRLYLARYSLDSQYYRAKIVSPPSSQGEVEVLFVDYGNTERTKCQELILLGELSKCLESFPPQVIRTHLPELYGKNFDQKMLVCLKRHLPEYTKVVVKVIKTGSYDNPPDVELFKRAEDNSLISVNNSVAYDPTIHRPAPQEVATKRGHMHLLTPAPNFEGLSGKFPAPSVPQVGGHLDLYVITVVNPGNFVVLPAPEVQKLQKLVTDMDKFYKTNKREIISINDIHEGDVFAGLHSDNTWLRVQIKARASVLRFSVYYCDFGDFGMTTIEQLQPLAEEFKKLPAIALRARLTRSEQIHKEWKMEDAFALEAQILHKTISAQIIEWSRDKFVKSGVVLGVRIFDEDGKDIEEKLGFVENTGPRLAKKGIK